VQTNRILSKPDRHVVVECNPTLLPTLQHNRDLNGCGFSIEPHALAYGNETMTFSVSDHFMKGRITVEGDKRISVRTITLSRLLKKYQFETINLICDSEGGEVEMVQHEAELLRDHVKCLILEIHPEERGAEAIASTLATLQQIGFDIVERDHAKGTVLALLNRRLTPPD
jgi:FkbM family methyltransferase